MYPLSNERGCILWIYEESVGQGPLKLETVSAKSESVSAVTVEDETDGATAAMACIGDAAISYTICQPRSLGSSCGYDSVMRLHRTGIMTNGHKVLTN